MDSPHAGWPSRAPRHLLTRTQINNVTAGRARRENHVLAAVYQLRGRGYIANINDKVTQTTGTRVLPASTSLSLSRLEKFGLIEPSSRARETYFKITIGGKRALAKTR